MGSWQVDSCCGRLDRRAASVARFLGRLVAVCVIVIAILGVAVSPDRTAASAAVADDYFGVSAPNFFVMSQKGQTGALDSYLTHIRETGVDWVRDAVPWPDAEPAAPIGGVHAYRWGAFDTQVTRYAQHDLTLQPVIRQTPAWAEEPAAVEAKCGRDGGLSALTGVAAYGDFVGAYLRRYGRQGSFWVDHPELRYKPVTRVELWNEPNWRPFYCPAPDPERYAEMVAAGADAAHAVDPDAVVSIGGLVTLKSTTYADGRPTGIELSEFLRRMTAAEPTLPDRVDAVAVHLYDQNPDGDRRRRGPPV